MTTNDRAGVIIFAAISARIAGSQGPAAARTQPIYRSFGSAIFAMIKSRELFDLIGHFPKPFRRVTGSPNGYINGLLLIGQVG